MASSSGSSSAKLRSDSALPSSSLIPPISSIEQSVPAEEERERDAFDDFWDEHEAWLQSGAVDIIDDDVGN